MIYFLLLQRMVILKLIFPADFNLVNTFRTHQILHQPRCHIAALLSLITLNSILNIEKLMNNTKRKIPVHLTPIPDLNHVDPPVVTIEIDVLTIVTMTNVADLIDPTVEIDATDLLIKGEITIQLLNVAEKIMAIMIIEINVKTIDAVANLHLKKEMVK